MTMKTTNKDIQSSIAKKHIEREVAGGAVGALAGAAVGAVAGPPGAIAGAITGAIAGAVTGRAAEVEDEERELKERELDRAIGVERGDLGAPNLKHPPAKIGAYSAGSTGAAGSTEEDELAEGPIQPPRA